MKITHAHPGRERHSLAHPRGVALRQLGNKQDGFLGVDVDGSVAVGLRHTEGPVEERLLQSNTQMKQPAITQILQATTPLTPGEVQEPLLNRMQSKLRFHPTIQISTASSGSFPSIHTERRV